MLALAVLISHAVFLRNGSSAAEPLVGLTGYSLGQYGVQGFFILSGILVTQSLMQRGAVLDYARARTLRIFPGLIVCALATALVLGPVMTTLDTKDYLFSPGVLAYLAKTLSLSTGSAALPGVFETSPAAGLINQSLWTLKYEVACYLLLGGIAAVLWRINASRLSVGATMAAWVAAMFWLEPNLRHNGNFGDTLAYFALFFGAGASAYLLRQSIRLSWLALPGLAVLFVFGWKTSMAEITSAAFLGFGLVWLSTFGFGRLRGLTNANDYSYGTYIYSYPVTQAILAASPGISPVMLVGLSLAITLVLAFLSWELIERPALALVRRWRKQESPLAARVAGVSRGVRAVQAKH